MPMILNGVLSPGERKQRAQELLGMVGMSARLDHVPSQLSGGEQQRVTIARAIANNPEILLLDEPTGDLDTFNTLVVLKLLTDLNQKQGITMVMVTHDVGLKVFADRVIWMRDGKIQRIEQNDSQKKEEAIKNLEKEIEEVKTKRKEKKQGAFTELRKPSDYKTNPKFAKRDIPIKMENGSHKLQTEEPVKDMLEIIENHLPNQTLENNNHHPKDEKNGS